MKAFWIVAALFVAYVLLTVLTKFAIWFGIFFALRGIYLYFLYNTIHPNDKWKYLSFKEAYVRFWLWYKDDFWIIK